MPGSNKGGATIDKSALDPEVLEYIETLEKHNGELTEALEDAVEALEKDDDGDDDADDTGSDEDTEDNDNEEDEDVAKSEDKPDLLSKASPEVQAMVAELKKSADDAAKRAEAAEKIAKEERDIRETNELTVLAKSLVHVNDDTDKFVAHLKVMKASLPKEAFDAQVEMMQKANKEIASGNLFSELGTDGMDAGVRSDIETKVDALRKSDSTLTREQAYAKVMKDNPDLYEKATEG